MEFLFSIISRFVIRTFSPTPEIKKEGGLLVIQSTWQTALLTLGGRHRRVAVDQKARVLRITDRRFWFFSSSRRIEFDWIDQVFYTYQDLESGPFSHYDQDLFTVGVKLTDGKHVTLFRFFGEGSFTNVSVWPDWCYWEDNLIARTAQHNLELMSSQLADVLCHLTGAPLTNDI